MLCTTVATGMIVLSFWQIEPTGVGRTLMKVCVLESFIMGS